MCNCGAAQLQMVALGPACTRITNSQHPPTHPSPVSFLPGTCLGTSVFHQAPRAAMGEGIEQRGGECGTGDWP